MKYPLSAIIFAGGESSRMGEDKALLPFGGYNTLSEFQYHKLDALFQKTYLSAKKNKFHFDCTVIADLYEESSPLVGIISIFETLKVDEVFILSVDAPFVDADSIKNILACNEKGADAIIAESSSGMQPLCGIYKRSILSLAKEQLEKENHRLGDLLKRANTLFVRFEEDSAFANLNHPEEYQQALMRF